MFYDNVAALYEYGLSVGKTDGTYGLADSMTVGEIVIFASRIRSLYASGDAEAGAAACRTAGQKVWQPHLQYLQAQGVLGTELDQACADAVLGQTAIPNSVLYDSECLCNQGDYFQMAHPDTEWQVCLEHAVKLGLGSRAYELVKI